MCRVDHDRWRLVRGLGSCNPAHCLELLTISSHSHPIILRWLLALNDEDLDANALEAWIEKLAKLVNSCPSGHRLPKTLARWRTIQILKKTLQDTVNDSAHLAGKFNSTRIVFRDDIKKHFLDLGLPIPGSLRICEEHLNLVRNSKL